MDFDDYELLRTQEAEHRCRNSLQIISTVVRKKRRAAQEAETHDVLTFIDEIVAMLSESHRNDGRATGRELKHRLETSTRRFAELAEGDVRIVSQIDEAIPLTRNQWVNISLIVQELVLNSVKHGFPDGRSGTIRIRLRRPNGSHIELTVLDDGVGPTPEVVSTPRDMIPSRGTQIVGALAKAMDGSVSTFAANGGGFGTRVRWPI